ncbi:MULTISPECIES: sulfatase-like hydrolase/transferase [unclassified Streptomyces]|uniref:sulfatase-like hydrolase/transferase n=1 Tax=unclassified Streptomyces TaxID=2593676 RepID=UPI00344CD388
MPSRRQFLAGSAAALALAALPGTPASAAPRAAGRAPNIVLVLADDLGYGELGVYGQEKIRTPRIDALAAEGLRFTQAYAAGPVCAPSRCALLTGLHSGHATVWRNPAVGVPLLGGGDTTFAEVLHSRGYRTGCFGKWGFGPEATNSHSHPNHRGFEEFYGYIDHGHAHQYYPSYLWHNGEKKEIPENANGARKTYATDLIEQRALDFIGTHAEEPFLLFLTPTLPHAPSEIPDASQYAGESWSAAVKGHAAQVSRLDTLVGKVVDKLKALGIEQDTLVLVTSDNGPHEENGLDPRVLKASGPLRGYKRNLYEGGVRVPLIAWQPGTVRPGTSTRPTPLTDLLPTFAELGAAPAPDDIDGISVAPLLGGGTAPAHSHLYWTRLDDYANALANAADGGRGLKLAEAVRRDDLKAVRFAPSDQRSAADSQWRVELYDLAADPGEKTDIAAANPDKVAALTALMRSSWTDTYTRDPYGVRLEVPGAVVRGEKITVKAVLTNVAASAWSVPQVKLIMPDGWQARATTPETAAQLAAGGSFTVTWEVTPAAAAAAGTPFTLRADASATYQGTAVRYSGRGIVEIFASLPRTPTADAYLSDLDWLSAANAWGPVERDASNGKQAAGDGTPISIKGEPHTKGLGVHAPSDIAYHLGGRVKRVTAKVGIDDFSRKQSPTAGGTRARVLGDGLVLYDSGALTAENASKPVDVDVTGVRLLRLVVVDNNANGTLDHTSWGSAMVRV